MKTEAESTAVVAANEKDLSPASVLAPRAAVSGTLQLPVTVYTPASPIRHPFVLLKEMFRDLRASRELALRLFIRDLSAQYRQSFLGYLWVFAPPLISALPWIYLSSQKILNAGSSPIPYPVYVLAGTTLWSAFTDCLNCPLNSFNAGRSMMTRNNFPREALVIAGLGQMLVNLVIRLLMLFAALLLFKVPFGAEFALAPIGVAAVIVSGLSLGFLIAPIGLLYGDVSRLITVFSSVWMILTPVVYLPPSSGFAGWLARWNPASPLIMTARDFLISQPPSHLFGFIVVGAVAVLLLAIGWLFSRLSLPIIAERMGG